MDPATASGIPLAVTMPCGMDRMTPESGAPAAPGVTITAHPIVTGGPGIFKSLLTRRKTGRARERQHRAFYRGAGAALNLRRSLRLDRRRESFQCEIALRLYTQRTGCVQADIALACELDVSLAADRHLRVGIYFHVAAVVDGQYCLPHFDLQLVVIERQFVPVGELEIEAAHARFCV